MKFRRRPSPLLLLLLPSLATALSAAAEENIRAAGTKNAPAVAAAAKADPVPTTVVDINSKPKYEIGTKDAPVDGKDGKPHAGPWVGT